MALRKAKERLTKVTLNLDSDVWDFLKQVYPKTGASLAARKILRGHMVNVQAMMKANEKTHEELEVEL